MLWVCGCLGLDSEREGGDDVNALVLLAAMCGQCGPGGCSSGSGYVPSFEPVYSQAFHRPEYLWRVIDGSDWLALYDAAGRRQVGAARDGKYMTKTDDGRFIDANLPPGAPAIPQGKVSKPEVKPKPETRKPVVDEQIVSNEAMGDMKRVCDGVTLDRDGIPNFGISRDKMPHEQQARYTGPGGQEIGRAEAMRLVGDGELTDDSAKLHVVVVGDKSLQDRVKKDIDGSTIKDAVHFKGYEQNDPMAKTSGYLSGVTLMKRDGQVLGYQMQYNGIAPLEKKVASARNSPVVDPLKLPPMEPKPLVSPDGLMDWVKSNPLVAMLLAVGAFLFFKGRQ